MESDAKITTLVWDNCPHHKVVLGDLHVFLLMILPGLKTFLESHRELLENWSTIPTMKPSLHLRWITILNRKQAH